MVSAFSGVIPARRSSTRSIKRKKFDDELVESSLVKTERGRIKTSCIVTAASTSAIVHPGHSVQAHSQSPGPFNSTSVGFGSCSGSDVATVDVGKPGTSYLSLTPVTTMTIASAPGQGVGMKSVKGRLFCFLESVRILIYKSRSKSSCNIF